MGVIRDNVNWTSGQTSCRIITCSKAIATPHKPAWRLSHKRRAAQWACRMLRSLEALVVAGVAVGGFFYFT
jgi:hypothetical protein